ncbi:MAG: cysteine desulfurase [Chlamydiia bacterium]|nr:cysteine desulfurase [Chlamydiia bacterium]
MTSRDSKTNPPIYLDHNAMGLLDPEFRELWLELSSHPLGNPSSYHSYGRRARNLIGEARTIVAEIFAVRPKQVLFCSGGTECLNQLLFHILNTQNGHIVTSQTEHAAVYHTIKRRAQQSDARWRATFLTPNPTGEIAVSAVEQAIAPDTRLIALMAANNETGVLNPLEEIGHLVQGRGIPLLVDAVAYIGKAPFTSFNTASAVCFSGHKLNAPPGTGIAILRPPFDELTPLLYGGPQEFGRRAGTENALSIYLAAQALKKAVNNEREVQGDTARRRDALVAKIRTALPSSIYHGEGAPHTCNVANLAFPGVDGETLLIHLDQLGVMASHGSACQSGALEPSRVLLGMGIERSLVEASIRFSLSPMTTDDEIDRAAHIIIRAVELSS